VGLGFRLDGLLRIRLSFSFAVTSFPVFRSHSVSI
jgi:hypothetical protein